MNEIQEFLFSQKPEVSGMERAAIESEVTMWRMAFQALPPEVVEYVAYWGQLVRVSRRNYEPVIGILAMMHFDIRSIEIATSGKCYVSELGRYMDEEKRVILPYGNVNEFNLILSQTEWYDGHKDSEMAESNLG